MIKKLLLIFGLCFAFVHSAGAACVATTKTYSACKPGYFLNGGACSVCIDGGTSDDKNDSGITACYVPAGTTGSDASGTFTYTENCHYSY